MICRLGDGDMENLIINADWCPGPDGGPMYFSRGGSTYDKLCMNGSRTCSISRQAEDVTEAFDRYDLAIDVRGQKAIFWGYIIRAVEADSVVLEADFYDISGHLMKACQSEISERITCQFDRHMVCFPIPEEAFLVRLAMAFGGQMTACTYYAPRAYFSRYGQNPECQ